MQSKGKLQKRFMDTVIAKKINLSSSENSAVTMFFGMENTENLITIRSLSLYQEGEQIVKKTLQINKGTQNV